MTEAIVFDAEASGLPAAASYLFDAAGDLAGDAARPAAIGATRRTSCSTGWSPLAERPRPSARHGVAYLPLLPRCRLVIVGGGHVGQAVGQSGGRGRFRRLGGRRSPRIRHRRSGFPVPSGASPARSDEVLPKLEITPNTYCLIVTRGHNHDEEALFHLVDRGARYVGMIGSMRKIKLIFDDLCGRGHLAGSRSSGLCPGGTRHRLANRDGDRRQHRGRTGRPSQPRGCGPRHAPPALAGRRSSLERLTE